MTTTDSKPRSDRIASAIVARCLVEGLKYVDRLGNHKVHHQQLALVTEERSPCRHLRWLAREMANQYVRVDERAHRRFVRPGRPQSCASTSSHATFRFALGTGSPARARKPWGLRQHCMIALDSKDDRVTLLDAERVSDRLGERDLALRGDSCRNVHLQLLTSNAKSKDSANRAGLPAYHAPLELSSPNCRRTRSSEGHRVGLPCAGRAYAITALPTIPQASSKATVGSMSMNASFGP